MAKATLDSLIEKTRSEYENKDIISFLGPPTSGKTVVASIFNYHLVKVWIPQSKGNWESSPIKGDAFFFKLVRKMKEGIFTDSTAPNEYPTLIREVYSLHGEPVTKQLTLHDISGETYVKLLSKEYPNEDDRLTEILNGNGKYLPWTSHYVIIVDCQDYDEWNTDISNVARMILPIKKIKQKIYKLNSNEKIHVPISVVFTKVDALDPEIRNKSPEALLDDYPGLRSALNVHHDQQLLSCFKVYVESDAETIQDQTKYKEEGKIQFEQKKISQKRQLDAIVDLAVNEAESKAIESKLDEKQIESEKEKARKKAINENRSLLQVNTSLHNQHIKSKRHWKVRLPFTYSESEYSKLISWIVERKIVK